MPLTASPFHQSTGELLPVYRDAYLRGDLSLSNAAAVDAYLAANRHLADETLTRFYELKQGGHKVKAVGWVQRQFNLARTEPQRLRRRAASLVVGTALLGSAVFAGTNLPVNTPTENLPTADVLAAAPAEAAAMRMVTVKGRILDENGKPLVGATVLQKGSFRGVSTDRNGHYALSVPAGQRPTLQFGYAGYAEEELQVKGAVTENVTLLPREQQEQPVKQKRRWLLF